MAILTTTEIELIKENQDVFNLVLNHGYLPNGYSVIVRELDKIWTRIDGRSTKLHCSSCIIDLFKNLNYEYNNQPKQDANGKKNKKS